MPHTIEPAASGRSKCRGCKENIAKDELRFGECLPNPFADGDMTIWFHITCAAYRRPASLAEVLPGHADAFGNIDALNAAIELGTAHDRATRICGAGRSPSARAKCRECREPIKKDEWRIALEFFEEGMFNPAGYVHTSCASEYFGTDGILDRVKHFAKDLSSDEIEELGATLA